jgi:hypothetical protein
MSNGAMHAGGTPELQKKHLKVVCPCLRCHAMTTTAALYQQEDP